MTGLPARHAERTGETPGAARPALSVVPRESTPLADQPARGSSVPSLRLLVPGVATLILALSMFLAASVAEDHSRALLVRELEARLVSEARQVALAASTSLFDDFPELRLTPALREFAAGRPDVVVALVLDEQGRVRGHLDARRIGVSWAPDPEWRPGRTPLKLREGERLIGDRKTLAVLTPVVHATGRRIGTAVVAIRRLEMEHAIEASRRTQGLLLLGVLALGSLAMLMLMLRLVAPVAAIRSGLERIGRGDLEGRLIPVGAAEFRMLSGSLNEMADRLRQAQLEVIERERLAGEMEIASRIHRSLLPSGRFVSGDFVMVGAHRPAAEVGGDYYDFLTRSDGRVALVVADVSGKGVGGALVTTMLASLLRAFCLTADAPSSLLILLEKHLGPRLERQTFITLWHGVLDPDTGRLIHAAAGHLPLLVVRAGATRGEWFRTRAVPLGIGGPAGLRAKLEDLEITFGPGDVMVQVTDGVTEAGRPSDGEQFGFARFEAAVVRSAASGPDAVVQAILDAVANWTGGPPQDDETILVVARTATSVGGERLTRMPVLEMVALAQSRGNHLRLDAALSELSQLRPWLAHHPDLAALAEDHRHRIELALYELCANVIEHGYRRSESGSVELCWVPDGASASEPYGGAPGVAAATGFFVIRDHGRPFDPGRGLGPDLRDPAIRRQGRGLGLELARRILTRLRYYPNTDYGNLTLMRFDPRRGTEDSHE